MNYCLSALTELDALLAGARRVLIAADFDGTLCPMLDVPSEIRVAPGLLEVLRHTTACDRLTFAVITGRALEDIRRRVPVDVVFAGNNGLQITGPGLSYEHPGAARMQPLIAQACERLSSVIREWPGAWVEDKGLSAALHYRGVNQREHHNLLFAARGALRGSGAQLGLSVGKLALEIRPRVPWDKGSALIYIQENAGPFDACMCLGDDRSDESMFRANTGQLNIRIGCARGSMATHYLLHPGEVPILLSHVLGMQTVAAGGSLQREAKGASRYALAAQL